MVSVVPYNRDPGIFIPYFKLDRKSDDMTLKNLVGVPFPGAVAEFFHIRYGPGQ